MTQPTLSMTAPKGLLLLIGLAHLWSPFGSALQRLARQAIRDIRRCASRNGFKQWDLLETIALGDPRHAEAVAVACLDAAGPFVVSRCVSALPGGSVRTPHAGLRGSAVVITLTAPISQAVH